MKLKLVTLSTYPKFDELLIKTNNACIIAALNPFGHIKYYKILSQDDINQLIRMSENGYSSKVEWYYLSHENLK